MQQKILSIIIPSYNMENYLNQCIESLPIAKPEKLEILIINDGSKDRTSEIGHLYEDQYPNSIRCIDKKNGNYGSCINTGLSIASGKYIKILDADDTFNKENLNTLVNILERIDADCVITNYQKVNSNGKIIKKIAYKEIPTNRVLTLSDIDNILVQKLAMHAVTYRTTLLKNIKYHQTEGISYTDMEWIYTPIAFAKTYIYIPLTIYNYLIGRDGQTMNPKILAKHRTDTILGIKTQTDLLEKFPENHSSKGYLKKRLAKRIIQLYETILLDEKDNRNLLASLDKEYSIRWEQEGIYITKLIHSPFGNISYVDKWREVNYDINFKVSFFTKIGIRILKIYRRLFPVKHEITITE